jgi:DtxR family Mn-dependent transcriptional regulator
MEWYQIHDEAERLEHAVSPAFEAKLIEKLGERGTCPHGNAVLPDSPAQRKKRGLISLFEAPEGAEYIVSSLYERDPKLLVFLHDHGIGPQSRVRVIVHNYDETVTVESGATTTRLGRRAAEKVWVKSR